MGRPKAFDRDQAVETAMNEIWRQGYEASSVNALADKMGITRSSLYNAFGSREALFKEALARYVANAPDARLDDVKAGDSVTRAVVEAFAELCRVRAADAEARGCMAINCVTELVGVNDPLSELLGNAVKSGIKRFEKLLRQAIRQGELADGGKVKQRALALQNLIIGLNTLSKVVRDESELWSVAEHTLVGLGFDVKSVPIGASASARLATEKNQ